MIKKSLNVIITGTNKGIGHDLVLTFLKNNPQAIIYATSRQKQQIFQQRWKKVQGNDRIRCKQLQMISQESIEKFVKQIIQEEISIDILIHNAAICNLNDDKEFMSKQWNQMSFQTNLFGPILLTEKIIPYLSNNAIVSFVSSSLAALQSQPQITQSKFNNPFFSKQDIYNAAKFFMEQSQNKKIINYNMSVYGTSKMLLAAWARYILQTQLLKGQQKAISIAPGFCKTQMTEKFINQKAYHTSQSGALSIYKTLFLEELNSEIFYHRARKSNFELCGRGLPFE